MTLNAGDHVVTLEGNHVTVCTGNYMPGHQIGKRYQKDQMYVEVRFDGTHTDWVAVRDLEPVRTNVRREDPRNDDDNLSDVMEVHLTLWVDLGDLLGVEGIGLGTDVVLSNVSDLSIGDKLLIVTQKGKMTRYPASDIKSMHIRPSKAAPADESVSSDVPRIVDEPLSPYST